MGNRFSGQIPKTQKPASSKKLFHFSSQKKSLKTKRSNDVWNSHKRNDLQIEEWKTSVESPEISAVQEINAEELPIAYSLKTNSEQISENSLSSGSCDLNKIMEENAGNGQLVNKSDGASEADLDLPEYNKIAKIYDKTGIQDTEAEEEIARKCSKKGSDIEQQNENTFWREESYCDEINVEKEKTKSLQCSDTSIQANCTDIADGESKCEELKDDISDNETSDAEYDAYKENEQDGLEKCDEKSAEKIDKKNLNGSPLKSKLSKNILTTNVKIWLNDVLVSCMSNTSARLNCRSEVNVLEDPTGYITDCNGLTNEQNVNSKICTDNSFYSVASNNAKKCLNAYSAQDPAGYLNDTIIANK